MLVNTVFYWSSGQIFNEIFNGFSSRLLSGTGTSRTRPLHGCGSKSDLISLQNESSGYDTTVSQVPTELGNVVCLRQGIGKLNSSERSTLGDAKSRARKYFNQYKRALEKQKQTPHR